MARSLSNLINNLYDGVHKIKCKYKNDDKKCEICGINYKYCDCFREYINFVTKIINKSLMKIKETILNYIQILIMITISLFHCCKKVFILMNIWMIGQKSIKHRYLKKKTFTAT